ncbi:MAG: glycosyl transferase family protein [Halioglobus sp.]|nr:glycosyl transferase family protein [Halioglobus sp.]
MIDKPSTSAQAEHPFAPYLRILGKGKTGTRSLTQDEARIAFEMILTGAAEPLQIGAFLMLLRVKEETPEELAGFVQACRSCMIAAPAGLGADLDWSCYAGKKHQHPWFILSMLLLAEAGYRVFVHGSKGHTAGRLYAEDALRQLRLPVAASWADVATQLDTERLSYLPLQHFCQPLQALIELKPLLGLRSPVNTLSRLVNPLRAPASLQSVFHPAYARLHQQADQILGQPQAMVFKGESGEIEVKPQADTRVAMLNEQHRDDWVLPRSLSQRIDSVPAPATEPLRALWRGQATDTYALNAVLATTALALMTLAPDTTLETAQQRAWQLWENRNLARLS